MHIKPIIGEVPLTALTRQHVDLVMNTARGKLKPSTLAVLRTVLGVALEHAVLGARRPQCRQADRGTTCPRREQHFLDRAGAQRMLSIINESEYAPIYLTMLTTGLRVGEALALRWQDVDLDPGQLSVVHTLQWVDGEPQLLEPKTASSRRTVRFPGIAVAGLRTHKATQSIIALDGSSLVFPSATGGPISADNVRRCFTRC